MRLLTYQEIDILFDRAATLRPVLIDGKPIIFSTLTRGDECINFAHAIIAATVAKLTAGVSVEPVNNDLADDISAIDCIHRGDPSYEHDAYYMRKQAEKCVRHGYQLFTAEAIAAARVQMANEIMELPQIKGNLFAEKAIRALIGGAT